MIRSQTRCLLDSMYGDKVEGILNDHGIVAGSPHWISSIPEMAVVGHTRTIGERPAPTVVLTATCIDHAEGEPAALAASVVADLVQGCAIAQMLQVPMVSFVGVGEEVRLVPGGHLDAKRWRDVGRRVDEVVATLPLPEGSKVVSCDDDGLWEALTHTVEQDRQALPDESLAGLYRLTDGSLFPAGTPFTYYFEYFRYNVAHYRRPVLEYVLGQSLRSVLVVENIHQTKAISTARRLNGDWPTEHLATLTAPGRCGSDSATRGSARMYLDNFLAEPHSWQQLAPEHFDFWSRQRMLYDRITNLATASDLSRREHESEQTS